MKSMVIDNKFIEIKINLCEDLIYRGLCVNYKSEILNMVNYDEESGSFDRYTIFRNENVEDVCLWDEDEINGMRINNWSEYIDRLSLEEMTTFYSSLKAASKF